MARWSNMAAGLSANAGCLSTKAWRWRIDYVVVPAFAGTTLSRRRLRRGLFVGEQMDQRALDRGLPRRRVDLRAEQIGDIKHVAGALAEGGDMGGGDVEVEFRDR